MATTNGTLVLPNMGLNDVPKSAEEKKRLMEMLLDPRVVSLAESSPETKKAIAGVVRKLQAERAKRRDERYRSPERKDEEAWGSKFIESFGCGPILRLFTGPTQKMPKRRRSALSVRRAVLSPQNSRHGKVVELQKLLPDPTLKPKMKPSNGSVVLCSRSDLNSIPLNLNGITIHVNGTDIPSSAALRKKYKDFAEMLLQKASIGSSAAVLNLLPRENKVHLPIIHDLEGNDCTNRKSISANVLPTAFQSAIIVLQPVKVIEVPVYHIRELPDPFDKLKSYAASSTQTDLSGELCGSACCCESDDTNYKLDVQGNPKYRQVVEVAQKLASMASGRPSSYVCSIKRQPSSLKKESDPYNQKTHYTEDDYLSSDESEVDPFDLDSGGRYLSKVIRYSKGPNKDLVSPEIIITYSGVAGCQGKCSDCDSTSCGSYDGCCKRSPSSSETVLDGTQHSSKWPRKRMMLTSCDSYYDEESDYKEENNRNNKNVTCQSSDQMTTHSDFNQGPPEISTGYSQLSYRDVKGYYSESPPDHLERNRNTEKLRYRSSEMCAVGNRDEVVSRQLGRKKSSVSSFESDGELMAERLFSLVSTNFNKNPELKKKCNQECPETRCRTVDVIPRRSRSSFCIFQESPPGRALEPDKPSDKETHRAALDEVPLSEISSQDLQTVYVAERRSDEKELNSSEEEQKRQYEKNLKTMRMRALNDKEISVSSIEEQQWTARKVKHKPGSKTKDKSRHKTCSIM